MSLFDNLLTVFVLGAIFLIIYLRVTNRTLLDLFKDIKEILADGTEEVITQ